MTGLVARMIPSLPFDLPASRRIEIAVLREPVLPELR
jgi:hypothetical protein